MGGKMRSLQYDLSQTKAHLQNTERTAQSACAKASNAHCWLDLDLAAREPSTRCLRTIRTITERRKVAMDFDAFRSLVGGASAARGKARPSEQHRTRAHNAKPLNFSAVSRKTARKRTRSPTNRAKTNYYQNQTQLSIGIVSFTGMSIWYLCMKSRQYRARGEPDKVANWLTLIGLLIISPLLFLAWLGKMTAKLIKKAVTEPETDDEDQAVRETKKIYDPYVGAEVTLRNLTKIEYNGLKGKIVKHIEEKER
jgi:hypothetical protein